MYGALFSNLTFLHFIESYVGDPIYRYDKKFSGFIVQEKEKNRIPTTLNYHCRPAKKYFDYDWIKLDLEMQHNKLMEKFTIGGCDLILIKARPLTFFLKEKFQKIHYICLIRNLGHGSSRISKKLADVFCKMILRKRLKHSFFTFHSFIFLSN